MKTKDKKLIIKLTNLLLKKYSGAIINDNIRLLQLLEEDYLVLLRGRKFYESRFSSNYICTYIPDFNPTHQIKLTIDPIISFSLSCIIELDNQLENDTLFVILDDILIHLNTELRLLLFFNKLGELCLVKEVLSNYTALPECEKIR